MIGTLTITKITHVENPDQHPAGVLVAVQKTGADDRGTGGQARAGGADAAANANLQTTATGTPGTPPATIEPKKIDVGTVAAMGVAVGAIGAAFTGLAGYLLGLFKLPFCADVPRGRGIFAAHQRAGHAHRMS